MFGRGSSADNQHQQPTNEQSSSPGGDQQESTSSSDEAFMLFSVLPNLPTVRSNTLRLLQQQRSSLETNSSSTTNNNNPQTSDESPSPLNGMLQSYLNFRRRPGRSSLASPPSVASPHSQPFFSDASSGSSSPPFTPPSIDPIMSFPTRRLVNQRSDDDHSTPNLYNFIMQRLSSSQHNEETSFLSEVQSDERHLNEVYKKAHSRYLLSMEKWERKSHGQIPGARDTNIISTSPFSELHMIREIPTHNHWQLRDLLYHSRVKCCDLSNMREDLFNEDVMEDDGQECEVLYYIKDMQCMMYDLKQQTVQPLPMACRFTFKPVSLCVHHEVLAVAGSHGELSVFDLQSAKCLVDNCDLGRDINNSCWINPQSSTDPSKYIEIFVGNNDNTVKRVTVNNSGVTSNSFLCTAAVNYCALSNDGNILAACGDNNEVPLFDIHRSQTSIGRFKGEYNDSAFSLSFSPNGRDIAVASQDGTIVVWDMRKVTSSSNTPALAKFSTCRPNYSKRNTSCRSVKYHSKFGVDLLLVSEHKNCIQVIDTRNYKEREIISVTGHGSSESKDITNLWNEQVVSPTVPFDADVHGFCICDNSKVYIASDLGITETEVDVFRRRMTSSGDLC